MTDHEKNIRDALITLFEADAGLEAGGTLGVTKWWKRVEDGFLNRRTPFGYVEFQRRELDSESSDIANVGYIYVYEVGVIAEAKSVDEYKADDNVTELMDAVETVLIANRTVSGNVDNLASPILKEFARGRAPDIAGDVSWGVLTVGFKKQITART